MTYFEIGALMKQNREDANISLQQVAKFVGVNIQTIIMWENGINENMNFKQLCLYAQAIGKKVVL